MTLLTLLTIASSLAAAGAAIATWRLWRRERERSDARVAALAAMVDPDRDEAPVLFSATPAAFGHDHPLLKVAAGFVLVVTVILTVALVTGDEGARPEPDRHAGVPLALLSMRHERSGGTFTVTGLVRNEAATPAGAVVATVLVFDRNGTFLASGRAPLDSTTLLPGEESPFRVAVPDVEEPARYRVTFRNDAGTVRHLDRRGGRNGTIAAIPAGAPGGTPTARQ